MRRYIETPPSSFPPELTASLHNACEGQQERKRENASREYRKKGQHEQAGESTGTSENEGEKARKKPPRSIAALKEAECMMGVVRGQSVCYLDLNELVLI